MYKTATPGQSFFSNLCCGSEAHVLCVSLACNKESGSHCSLLHAMLFCLCETYPVSKEMAESFCILYDLRTVTRLSWLGA